jgi:hypothetical protein
MVLMVSKNEQRLIDDIQDIEFGELLSVDIIHQEPTETISLPEPAWEKLLELVRVNPHLKPAYVVITGKSKRLGAKCLRRYKLN